jgi:hypothetical protein
VTFHNYPLSLLVMAVALIFAAVICRACSARGHHMEEMLRQPETKPVRRNYFYPTRRLNGNRMDHHGPDLQIESQRVVPKPQSNAVKA